MRRAGVGIRVELYCAIVALCVLSTLVSMRTSGAFLGFNLGQPWRAWLLHSHAEQSQHDKRGEAAGAAVTAVAEAAAAEDVGGIMSSANATGHAIVSANITMRRQADLVYGHLHIAKTAGSTINTVLALYFDNVCGHKGYSYDAVQSFDQRGEDLFSKNYPGFSRRRVPQKLMAEIGFENCDWISQESNWKFWEQFSSWPAKLQIHIPCRDPIDHIMSIFNHKNKKFRCDSSWKNQIDQALRVGGNRFSKQMLDIRNLEFKCVRFQHFIDGSYFRFMLDKLRERRIKRRVANLNRKMNKKRNKDAECVWQDKKLQKDMNAYLLEVSHYYQFCSACTAWLI